MTSRLITYNPQCWYLLLVLWLRPSLSGGYACNLGSQLPRFQPLSSTGRVTWGSLLGLSEPKFLLFLKWRSFYQLLWSYCERLAMYFLKKQTNKQTKKFGAALSKWLLMLFLLDLYHRTVAEFITPRCPLWHEDYLRLINFKKLQTQEKLWRPRKSSHLQVYIKVKGNLQV